MLNPPGIDSTRARLAAFISGCAMAWTIGWYTSEGGRALLGISVALILLAVIFNRIVLTTARAIIWTGVGLLIVLLAANLERVIPPEDIYNLAATFLYDRVVTIALVPAFVALFMRPGRAAATMTISGILPMFILILARGEIVTGATTQHAWFAGSAVAAFLLVGQAHNIARPRGPEVPPLRGREIAGRAFFITLAVLLAALMALPAGLLLKEGARWLHGKRMLARLYQRDHGAYYLSLAAPPGGHAGQMRAVMSIDAPRTPGYLRQHVYRDLLSHGAWAQRSAASGVVLMPSLESGQRSTKRIRYDLPVDREPVSENEDWRIRVIGPRWRLGAALPQHLQSIHLSEALEITLDPDDKIGWRGGISPADYAITIPATASHDDFSLLGPPVAPRYFELSGDPHIIERTYLKVPEELLPDVMDWLAGVEGLEPEAQPVEIMKAIIHHFHRNFTYRIEGPPSGPSGDVHAFMRDRQGHCTLFATAATLMLRASGIPARMIGGYLVTDRHPVTGEWVVRVRDGHAWAEAWDADAGGWRRIEATAPGGLPMGFAPPGSLRAWLEALRMGWRDFVDWARHFNPIVWLAETGATVYVWMEELLATTTGRVSAAALVLLIAAIMMIRNRRPPARDETTRLRMMLTAAMTRLANRLTPPRARRRPHETWPEWLARARPDIPVGQHEKLDALVAEYQTLRYARRPDHPAVQNWIARARQGQRPCIIPGAKVSAPSTTPGSRCHPRPASACAEVKYPKG